MRVGSSGKIIEIGSSAALLEVAGGYSLPVNLMGALVVPGLVDAHVHLMMGGLQMAQLDLSGARGREDLRAAVEAALAGAPPGSWLLGHGWRSDRLGGGPPEASWIDEASPNNPVYLEQADKHSALANSAAMALAGVTAETADPPGGAIVRAPGGARPTGLLRDSAMFLVQRVLPAPSLEERNAALERAMDLFLSHGVTQVHEMGWLEPGASWRDLQEVLMPAANGGRLRLRVHAAVPLSTAPDLAEMTKALGFSHPDRMLSWGTVKAFADGSLGSRTALMAEPYLDTGSRGLRVTDQAELEAGIIAADSAGLQVAVHAIGDRAVDDVLEIFEAAERVNGWRGPHKAQHRIEHVQHLSGRGAIRSLAARGVHAVVNPLHLPGDQEAMKIGLGEERSSPQRSYAFQAMLQAGVKLSAGSDWPVVPADPLGSLRIAMFRNSSNSATADMEAEDALKMHVNDAGATLFHGGLLPGGVLKPGKLADFVVLAVDPSAADARMACLQSAQVWQTYVGGKRMYLNGQL